eukprot:m.23877 g.23877  ORF g.23877 m.23877 type:complete len:323 (-) comp4111_c0_seq1:133-1101(-)
MVAVTQSPGLKPPSDRTDTFPHPNTARTHAQFHIMVLVCRALVLLCCCVVVWNKSYVDATLAVWWSWLREQPLFRHDSFEPMLATLSFFPPLIFFYTLDMHSATKKGAWLKRYHVRNSDDMTAWRVLSWREVIADPTQSRVPVLLGYILPLVVFDALYPRRRLPNEAPGIVRLVGENILMLVVYDALFWMVHRTLHSVPLLYRNVHKKHHTNTQATRANDAVRLTFSEEVLDVGCSIVAVNVTRAHPMSRALYDIVIVYLLVELHCGFDFPWMPHNLAPRGWMGGPRRHDAHHADGRHYFQKFFCYIDDAVGPIGSSKAKAA